MRVKSVFYLFLKITSISFLLILFSFAFYHLVIRLYLTEFYLAQARFKEIKADWPEIFVSYNSALKFAPFWRVYYKNEYAQGMKRAADEYYSTSYAKTAILSVGIRAVESIPEQAKTLPIFLKQGELLSEKYRFSQEQRDYIKAKNVYFKIISLSPLVAGVYNNWCQLEIYKKDWLKAERICKKALSLYPSVCQDDPLVNQGHCQEVIREKIKVYEKLGEIYQAQNNLDEALIYWKKILKASPFQYHIHKKVADIYFQRGDIDKAIQENFHGFVLNPRDSAWPFGIALLYQKKGDLLKAENFAEIALKISPDDKRIENFLEKLKGTNESNE